jgi:hypothetical protein
MKGDDSGSYGRFRNERAIQDVTRSDGWAGRLGNGCFDARKCVDRGVAPNWPGVLPVRVRVWPTRWSAAFRHSLPVAQRICTIAE